MSDVIIEIKGKNYKVKYEHEICKLYDKSNNQNAVGHLMTINNVKQMFK